MSTLRDFFNLTPIKPSQFNALKGDLDGIIFFCTNRKQKVLSLIQHGQSPFEASWKCWINSFTKEFWFIFPKLGARDKISRFTSMESLIYSISIDPS